MSEIDDLITAYAKHASLPWVQNLAPGQRTWMVVYPPTEERRVRARLIEFENATRAANKKWLIVDLSNSFGSWIGGHAYRDRYFANPNLLSGAALGSLREFVAETIGATSKRADSDSVVAILGIGSLFPFTEVSGIIESAAASVDGRLAVFFPGEHRQDNYRLLDARDGWNYLATAITSKEG